jgi:hypothetical protein
MSREHWGVLLVVSWRFACSQVAREMIVVLPDSKTAYSGSFYSRSATTGDFETYVAHDSVIRWVVMVPRAEACDIRRCSARCTS